MRASCRAFLERLRLDPSADRFEIVRSYLGQPHRPAGLQDWVLNQAIGQLRGVFGVHIALMAARCSLEVEEDLATILPSDPDD